MTITIGELASRTGVGIETIRFYEKKGLIPDPERSHSGYRQYPEDAVRRIRFVLHAKDLGFSLAEIGELLSLRVERKSAEKNRRHGTTNKNSHGHESQAQSAYWILRGTRTDQ